MSGATVLDHFIQLRGLRFHYREWPAPDAPTLVLLHGLSSQARSWDQFAQIMRDRYRVLALDQRGHGETGWADSYTQQEMADDLAAFADALKLARFALLGFSMGGRSAYAYAAQHRDRVERLVIVDIGPEVVESGGRRVMAAVAMPDVFNDREEAYGLTRLMNPRPAEDTLRERVFNNLVQTEDGRWTWRYDKKLRQPGGLARPDTEENWAMLAGLGCPTLVVRGAETDILSRETAEGMVQTIPHSRLVEVPDCAHNIPLENLPGFVAAVRPFLLEV